MNLPHHPKPDTAARLSQLRSAEEGYLLVLESDQNPTYAHLASMIRNITSLVEHLETKGDRR